ncbi:protein of unknown function [Rhodovastum atsumiense]|nr:protein of unknown function [Rhodovastum atsumiense]
MPHRTIIPSETAFSGNKKVLDATFRQALNDRYTNKCSHSEHRNGVRFGSPTRRDGPAWLRTARIWCSRQRRCSPCCAPSTRHCRN